MSSENLPDGSRSYSSPLREEQARATRRRILDAALGLLLDQGYAATTMAGVAKAAGVSVQTVYKVFGTKPALVKAVYDVTLVGDDEPIPFAARPEVRAAYAEPDPRRFIAAYARLARVLTERLGPLLAVLVAGARAGEPDLVEMVATFDAERLVGTTMVANRLADLGALRPGLSVERASDVVWALNSVQLWELLVRDRGWSVDEHEQWMAEAIAAAVLA